MAAPLPLSATIAVEIRDGRPQGAMRVVAATGLAASQALMALPPLAAPQAPGRQRAQTAPPFGVREVVPVVHALQLHPLLY